MKAIRHSFFNRYNVIISFVLSLLGFSGCTGDNGSTVVEYGTPYAAFVVQGKVQSDDNSSAIPNAQVVMGYDTTYSNSDGTYRIQTYAFPEDQSFQMVVNDIDGTENGSYESTDTIAEFIDPQFTGASGWYNGEVKKEINFKLKAKN